MLTLPPGVKLCAFTEPVDARKSFDAKLATHTSKDCYLNETGRSAPWGRFCVRSACRPLRSNSRGNSDRPYARAQR